MVGLGRIALGLAATSLLIPQADALEGRARRGPFAVRAAKALTCAAEGTQILDHAVMVVRDGRIEAIGPAREVAIPADCEVIDVGDRWILPGLIDLHCHVAGTFDINDMVHLSNPGLRASPVVIPSVWRMDMGLAGGVTTVLFIPGSGTNIGGQGILVKTDPSTYEEMLVRNPGSLKLAQWGNPERWTIGVGKTFENWNTRNSFRRGLEYAEAWRRYENGEGPEPRKDIQWEVFRDLLSKETQVSVHTQIYQVVLATITMIRLEFGLDVYIDHGTFDGWRAGGLAQEAGVPAIIGPRQVDVPTRGMFLFSGSRPERIQGIAAGYQELGHEMVGFNTDSPGVPQEELSLQAAMGVRYGFKNEELQALRGLTIVPALAAGIADRVGSLEVGKDADFLVADGDPADPRTTVSRVFIEGRSVYDAESEQRRW